MTENHDLNTPSKGAEGWHTPLNENFQTLDAAVPVTGTDSSRSAYEPKQGALYLAVDTGVFYRGTGTTWEPIGELAPYDGGDDGNGGGGGDDGGDSNYFDGDRLRSSEYDSLQAAVNAASARDRVLVDTDHVLNDWVTLKSDILVLGDGGTIRAADGTGSDVLRPENVTNVWIDGVTIDGGWEGPDGDGGNVGTRLIGGINPGPVSNLRVTNCTLRNSGLNAIELGEKGGATIEDVYVANNTITNARNHGVVIWAEDDPGESTVRNAIVEDNLVERFHRAQGIGFFGRGNSYVENVAILNNRVKDTATTDMAGAAVALEENVRYGIAYGNDVTGRRGAKNGCAVTKSAKDCAVLRNRVDGAQGGITALSFAFFDGDPNAPVDRAVFARNYATDADHGFSYQKIDGRVHVANNRFENTGSPVINDRGDNTGTITFENNGAGVSDAGLPASRGTGVSYSDARSSVEASWSRGSVDPNDPVEVSVSVDV